MRIRATGTVTEKKEEVEKTSSGTTRNYYIFVKFTNPQTRKTETARLSVYENQYRGYRRGESIDLVRETDNMLGIFPRSWQIDD